MTTLWYTRPASVWQEALPIGNGRLGGMVLGGIRRERIQLNEDTLWGGGPYSPSNPSAHQHLSTIQQFIFDGKYDEAEALGNKSFMGFPKRQPAYQTIGDLYIEMHGVAEVIPKSYKRELDLDEAMVKVEYETEDAVFTRKYIVSPDHQVVAVHITTSIPGTINLNIFANSPHGSSNVSFEGDDTLVLKGRNSPENGITGALRFETRCEVRAKDGTTNTTEDQIQIRDSSKVTILIAIATNFKRYNDVSGDPHLLTTQTLSACRSLSFNDIALATAKSHQTLFRRVTLTLDTTPQSSKPTDERLLSFQNGLPDPSLIALYFQFGRYLLITSSRPGSQPTNLQGIWNDSLDPGWGCGYTININTQMNYWLAEPTNLPEMVEPLIKMIGEIAEAGKVVAREMYGAGGWVCHQNTDIWRSTAPNTGAQWSLWPVGGAWLCRHLWDHWEYNPDERYLKEIYPILVGACEFFLDTMVLDKESGYMVTNPSCSPENVHGVNGSKTTLCAGPTMDMQILRDLFTHTILSSEILGEDPSLRGEISNLRDKLRPTTVGGDGRINEWPDHLIPNEPEPNHRHTSHLFGLYPSHQIHPETQPDLAQACLKTLECRGPAGTGWAAAWRINLYARLHNPTKAYEMIKTLLCEMTYPNLFDVHPPLSKAYAMGTFQIDGNLGGTAGIMEMLVQCGEGGEVIWVLPALAVEMGSGEVRGVAVRGGWTVDVVWRDMVLVEVGLVARVGGSKVVRYGSVKRVVTLKAGEHAVLRGADLNVE